MVDREVKDDTRCIKEFMADPYSGKTRRCEGKAGHGPHGMYCEHCAGMIRAAWNQLDRESPDANLR